MKKHAFTLAALALLASGGAFAQQTLLEDINVSAQVTAACSALTATDVDFGAQAATDTAQDAASTITVTCDSGTAYTVEIDYGASSLGPGLRQVTGAGGEFMDYEIFQPDGTSPWGLAADGFALSGSGTGAADPLTATFRLQRTSGASPGNYTDLVGVTLTY